MGQPLPAPPDAQTKAKMQSKCHGTHPSQGTLTCVTQTPQTEASPPQPLLLHTSFFKQHFVGLYIFLGNVYLDFHPNPGGISDLEKVKSANSSGRRRFGIGWLRPGGPCHPRFSSAPSLTPLSIQEGRGAKKATSAHDGTQS